MYSNRLTSNRLRTFFLSACATCLLVLSSGCVLEVDPNGNRVSYDLGDIEVTWTVSGSTSAALCDAYGIERWRVSVHGPESRVVDMDCRRNYWTTEADLRSLAAGSYTIRVEALDVRGYPIAARVTDGRVYDDGGSDLYNITFSSADF